MKEKENDIMVNVESLPVKDVKKEKRTSVKMEVDKFPALDGKFLLVKVGTNESPSRDEEIKKIESQLVDLFSKNNINCVAFVTHHAVTMEIIEDHS